MKLKGVGIFEQNVEKIVLGAVSAVFLGVVAMQFLYEPNTIKVGNSAPLAPGKAFDPVRIKAVMIKGKMDASAEALALPDVPKLDLVDDFKRRHAGPVAPQDRLLAFGPGTEVQGTVEPVRGPLGTQELVPLVVPATAAPVVSCYRNTLDPTETISHPQLMQLIKKDAQPFDMASVSVEAQFDGSALKAALLGTTTTEAKASSYPPQWWRDSVEILGVKLERQERGTGDQWGAATEVPLPPGRGIPDLMKHVKGQADMADVLGTVRGAANDILRPEFYRVIAGSPWKPPSEVASVPEGGSKNEQLKILMDARTRLQKELIAQQQQLEKAGQGPGPRNPGGGGGGGKGAGGGGGGGQAPPDPEKKLKPIRDRIQRIEDNLAKNESDIKALGFDADGNPVLVAVVPPPAATTTAAKSLLDNTSVRVWAHDVTVTPGKAYRYRLKVLINNPAFGRAATLSAAQQDLARSPVVESTPSEWSEPVTVLADKYYFVTSGSPADGQGPARATAELFQFFYGYYRTSSVYLEPGDLLAGPVKLPPPEKLPIWDMTKLAAADPNLPAAAPPPGQPANPRAPAIPPQLQPGKRGGQVIEETGRPPAAGQEAAKIALPDNAKPWSGPVRVAFDSYLLDVARVPGASTGVQAFLRDVDGSILTRSIAEEEKADTYRILTASAKDGENQGQPAAPVLDKKPDAQTPTPTNRDPQPPRNPGGGGGGGGGGG